MSKNAHDRMKDPFYGYLMAVIENVIAEADTEASERTRPFTDSQVRSALIKSIQTARGGKPAVPSASEHEKLLADLIARILRKREDIRTREAEEDGEEITEDFEATSETVSPQDWIRAIEAVVAALKIRTQMAAHPRGYLDFIHEFVQKAPPGITVER
jgi:hypothetical protein